MSDGPNSLEESVESELTKMGQDSPPEQLLLLLQPFSHGNWGNLNLNRIALFGRNLKHARSDTQQERLQDTIKNYIEKTFPAIQIIVQETRRNSMEPDVAKSLIAHAEKLAAILKSELWRRPSSSDEMLQLERAIPLHVDEILHAFGTMRKEVLADFRCKPFDVIAELANIRRESLGHHRIRLLNNISLDQPSVVISREKFSASLGLIIDFFLSAAPQNKTSRLISFNARTYLERWLLEISDSGIRLPPGHWQEVFEPQQKHPHLARVVEILQKFDGDISIKESIPDKGTIILVRLKLV